jgi:hypothetical protein
LHRKTVYFSGEEWDAIRRRAFAENGPYTDIVRDAVRQVLNLKAPRASKSKPTKSVGPSR